MCSGPIGVAMTWSYTIFTLAYTNLLKNLSFTTSRKEPLHSAEICFLAISAMTGSFLAFRPLLNCHLLWEAFYHLPSVWVPSLQSLLCSHHALFLSLGTYNHFHVMLLIVQLFVYVLRSECKPNREETLLMLFTVSFWVQLGDKAHGNLNKESLI